MAEYIRERTCIGCMKKAHKSEYIRIVKPKGENVMIDTSSSLSGRGAYFCKDVKCVDIAIKKKKLQRALRCEIDSSFYNEIKEYILSLKKVNE